MKLTTRTSFTIVVILFILSFVKVQAQSFPMADEDSRWTYTYEDSYEVQEGFWQNNTNSFVSFIKGDTLINDTLFHQIWNRLIRKTASGPNGNYDSVYFDKQATKGNYLYEDSKTGLYLTIDTNRKLLKVWDYQLAKGDTFLANVTNAGPTEFVVDSIGLFTDKLNNDRKQWFVSLVSDGIMLHSGQPASFIEGIGTYDRNGGGFIHGFNIEGNGLGFDHTFMGCYGFQGQSIIRTCPDFALSITKKLNQQGWVIYPNPSSDVVFIENNTLSNFNSADIKVFDISGKQLDLKATQIENELLKIDLSKAANGVYFVEIQLENQKPFVSRVIKQ